MKKGYAELKRRMTRRDMERLRNLRKEKGYTQIKMQLLTGIDQSDYSKIEKGKRYYTFEQCKRIALALDTSMDYLAGLTNEPRPYPRAGGKEIRKEGVQKIPLSNRRKLS